MGSNWLYIKYLKITLLGSFKFVAGIIAGVTGPTERRLSPFETIFFTTLGMMITVVIITFVGEKLLQKRIHKQKKAPKKKPIKINWKKRLITKIKTRWGLLGISFLTPLLFSPIGGALLAISIGAPRVKIYIYMLISAVLWGIILTYTADELVQFFEMLFGKNT